MSTTNLFVELLVIGSGVFVWIALLILAVVGLDLLPLTQSVALISAIPALSLVYVLGIVWDRISDALFGRIWGDGLRQAQFSSVGEYYNARRLILTESVALSELLEYGRSRLRICRGWTLNAPLIGFSLCIFLATREGAVEVKLTTYLSIIGLSAALAMGSWFSWRSLVSAEYRKIKEQAGHLKRKGDDA
jgi:hypothetical protein